MTRQSPDFHDNPRRETQSEADEQQRVLGEAERRTVRRGTDMARLAIGLEPIHTPEESSPFLGEESKRLASLIDKSDISSPVIKNRILFMIEAARQREAITAEEAAGLKDFLEHAEGFSDAPKSDRDIRERQATTN